MRPYERDLAVIAEWLHGLSPRTQDGYRKAAGDFLALAGVPLAEVQLAHVQAYADSLSRLKPSSRNTRLASIKSLCAFASSQGHIPANPARALRLPKTRDTLAQRILTEDEERRIIAAEKDPVRRLIVRLLYASAMRASELAGLKARDIQAKDERSGRIEIFGKGGKTRSVPIGGELWSDLAEFTYKLTPDQSVFGMSRFGVYRVVRGAAEAAGVRLPEGKGKNVSPHWQRHAHATHALKRGAKLPVVRDTLGHSSIAITDRYTHVLDEESSADLFGSV